MAETSTLEIRIDWSELDYFGHVNNLAFFKYIQASRVHLWQQIGLYQHHLSYNIGPILASTACQFRKSLYFPGSVRVVCTLTHIGRTSFRLHHTIYDAASGALSAEAEDLFVIRDFSTHENVPFPADIRQRLDM